MDNSKELIYAEKTAKHGSGMAALLLNILATLAAIALIVFGGIFAEEERYVLAAPMITVGTLYVVIGCFLFAGLKIIGPNEAIVLTLFGTYKGILKDPGYYWVNPFMSAARPKTSTLSTGTVVGSDNAVNQAVNAAAMLSSKISLKSMTLNNNKQKINDKLGNPIEIGIVVIWRVVNPTMAVFNVENYKEFLSIQSDSALRSIVREYPYDRADDGDDEKTLRGGTLVIAEHLRAEIQEKTSAAGLEIMEARITHLSYAPEIAAAMLQRQQASAVIDARQMIVEGAVGMVEMALNRLNKNGVVKLDEERKAAMVSNLLVVLCGNKDAQPIVNSGSLY
ncbi:MAG: SPFH domain-containing protein [Oscillospiraceae bacterium]|jgi:regulator of protease activity HflC (stomatin/prohibitin superfamily)|nr:SPFH domain-containing protein [Oscillospiraceae bacterium]